MGNGRTGELGRVATKGVRALAAGDLDTIRAAWWATTAAITARRQLRARPLTDLHIAKPTGMPPEARRGVTGALRATRATCLVRAAVLQTWDAAHGIPRDLVIGVTSPTTPDGFRAHAWLDGDPSCHSEAFHELSRLPAR